MCLFVPFSLPLLPAFGVAISILPLVIGLAIVLLEELILARLVVLTGLAVPVRLFHLASLVNAWPVFPFWVCFGHSLVSFPLLRQLLTLS